MWPELLKERGNTVRILVRDPKRVRETDAEIAQGISEIPSRLQGRWKVAESYIT